MTRGLRAAVAAVAAFATLALAGAASAANTGTLSVSYSPMTPGSTQAATIKVETPQTDDSIAQVDIYTGTELVNGGGAPGTQIGQVEATAFAHDIPGGLVLPLTGPVTTDDPAKHAADVCSPGTNFAVWNMNLSAAGQTLVIPIYVNKATGAAAALGAYELKICLPAWDTPAGSANHAFQGAQLLTAALTLNKIFTAPTSAGLSKWDALFVPYTPKVGTPNPAGTFEARAFVPLPDAVSIRASYNRKTGRWSLAGKATEGGQPVAAGASVVIYRGSSPRSLKKVATTTVRSGGAWSTAGHLSPKKLTYFQAAVTLPERDYAPGCESPAAPAGCVGAKIAGWSARSAVAKIRP